MAGERLLQFYKVPIFILVKIIFKTIPLIWPYKFNSSHLKSYSGCGFHLTRHDPALPGGAQVTRMLKKRVWQLAISWGGEKDLAEFQNGYPGPIHDELHPSVRHEN